MIGTSDRLGTKVGHRHNPHGLGHHLLSFRAPGPWTVFCTVYQLLGKLATKPKSETTFVDVKQMFLNANADAGRGRLCAVQLSLPPSPTGRGAGKQTHALVRDCRCCEQQKQPSGAAVHSSRFTLVGGRRSPHVGIFFPLCSLATGFMGCKKTQ